MQHSEIKHFWCCWGAGFSLTLFACRGASGVSAELGEHCICWVQTTGCHAELMNPVKVVSQMENIPSEILKKTKKCVIWNVFVVSSLLNYWCHVSICCTAIGVGGNFRAAETTWSLQTEPSQGSSDCRSGETPSCGDQPSSSCIQYKLHVFNKRSNFISSSSDRFPKCWYIYVYI